jgi:hypothetical protein
MIKVHRSGVNDGDTVPAKQVCVGPQWVIGDGLGANTHNPSSNWLATPALGTSLVIMRSSWYHISVCSWLIACRSCAKHYMPRSCTGVALDPDSAHNYAAIGHFGGVQRHFEGVTEQMTSSVKLDLQYRSTP